MNIKINKNGKEIYDVEFSDGCKSDDVIKIVDGVMTKDNEFRLGLTNIITSGIVNGLMRLVETLVESEEKRQLDEKQLLEIIRVATYKYENYEQLYTNATISIKEIIAGKINNFEIAGIKVSGYNPETKLFSIAA